MKFVRKTVIKDLAQTNDYLTRWSFPRLFGWGFKLHKIERADEDRCRHCHPWKFFRIILWGGYVELAGPENREQYILPWRPWAPWRVYYCPADFSHRITRLLHKTSWTLALVKTAEREWGFYTKTGWVPWYEFIKTAISARVLWCDDGRELTPNLTDHEQLKEVGR